MTKHEYVRPKEGLFVLGHRVQLTTDFETEFFDVGRGAVGTVTQIHEFYDCIIVGVQMDAPVDGCEEWNNTVQFTLDLPGGCTYEGDLPLAPLPIQPGVVCDLLWWAIGQRGYCGRHARPGKEGDCGLCL